jgi:osmoprotectant transport system permease protein
VNGNLGEQLALLPGYLAGHVMLSMLALATGMCISVPAGIFIARRRWAQGPVLGTASVIQTIPGLALLALMVVGFGQIGFWPAYAALSLYSMLPILWNTVTGINGVNRNVVEAARGIGMTPRQILLKVELPLALPVLIAGVRTATVWTVGLATLSTPVGATSLGNYIFSGLQTQNYTAVVMGCVSSAVLALALDQLIRLLRVSAEDRRPRLATGVIIVLAIILGGGLFPSAADLVNRDDDRITVGGKGFTEQYIVARLIAYHLEGADIPVAIVENLGSTVAFEATARGNISCYVEYSGTAWANYMGHDENPGRRVVRDQVADWLEAEHGLGVVGDLGFENRYALAMRRDQAAALGISSVEDLRTQAKNLTIASDYEFFSRPEWYTLREAYDLTFAEKKSMDPSLIYQAVQEGAVDVITAYTTDGRITAFDLVLLEDPREAFLPYDAMLVTAPGIEARADFHAALQPLMGSITSDAMRRANGMVDVENRPIAEAVAYLVAEIAAATPAR